MSEFIGRIVRFLFVLAFIASAGGNVYSYYRLHDQQTISYVGEGKVMVKVPRSTERTELLMTVFRTQGLDTGMDRMIACSDIRNGKHNQPQLTYVGTPTDDDPNIVITLSKPIGASTASSNCCSDRHPDGESAEVPAASFQTCRLPS